MILPGHKVLGTSFETYCICDDDVQTAQSIYCLLHNPLTICQLSHVLFNVCQISISLRGKRSRSYALDQNSLGLVLSFYLLGDLFRSVLTRIVIYCQSTPFSGELLGYKCA